MLLNDYIHTPINKYRIKGSIMNSRYNLLILNIYM